MEGELFIALYALLRQQAKLRKRRRRVIYSDELILLVFFWSVVHDRPRCWACQSQHWPPSMRWLALPSESTLCRRMRSVSVMLLLTMLYEHLKSLSPPTLVHRVDSKPLPVGGLVPWPVSTTVGALAGSPVTSGATVGTRWAGMSRRRARGTSVQG